MYIYVNEMIHVLFYSFNLHFGLFYLAVYL